MKKFVATLFLGNWFYGICVVALTISSSLIQGFIINSLAFYMLLFCITTFYYTIAYNNNRGVHNNDIRYTSNPRLCWYAKNRLLIFCRQVVLCLIMMICLINFLSAIIKNNAHIYFWQVIFVCLIGTVCMVYYAHFIKTIHKYTLRKGLVKPFAIGFVWAGTTTILPAIAMSWLATKPIHNAYLLYTFTDYFLLISLLSIMFDIKDFEDDYNAGIKTFVVRYGVKNAVQKILLPSILFYFGLMLLMNYILVNDTRILFSSITIVIMLLFILKSIQNKRGIFYYLIWIDGVMLLKAILDMIAIKL